MVAMKRMVHDGTRCSYKDAFSLCVRGDCRVSAQSGGLRAWHCPLAVVSRSLSLLENNKYMEGSRDGARSRAHAFPCTKTWVQAPAPTCSRTASQAVKRWCRGLSVSLFPFSPFFLFPRPIKTVRRL